MWKQLRIRGQPLVAKTQERPGPITFRSPACLRPLPFAGPQTPAAAPRCPQGQGHRRLRLPGPARRLSAAAPPPPPVQDDYELPPPPISPRRPRTRAPAPPSFATTRARPCRHPAAPAGLAPEPARPPPRPPKGLPCPPRGRRTLDPGAGGAGSRISCQTS
uniref:Vegetative cell wall protein gp1-like n=1 Tax=Castor canadensis TaxID=51338 RepID=A0A8B7TW95_CASCN|nr:vegetative cell wall protein gp1-like [Castor canadensis]